MPCQITTYFAIALSKFNSIFFCTSINLSRFTVIKSSIQICRNYDVWNAYHQDYNKTRQSLSPLPWNHLNATVYRYDNKGKVKYREKQLPGDVL